MTYAAVRYVETPLIDDVERRVIRACKTIRVLPDREWMFLNSGFEAAWLFPVVDDYWGEYNIEEWQRERPRFRPTPFDVSDVLVALGWCCVLERRDFKIIWWRSLDWSFSQIALRIGRSKQRAQQRYRDIMLKVWEKAQNATV